MDNKQKKLFIDYFKNAETVENEFKTGIEIEHFLIQKGSLKAVSYFEENGVEDILKDLFKKNKNWKKVMENNHLLGLKKDDIEISLEPGGQIEVSISPQKYIENLEKIYMQFLDEIIPIIEEKNKYLINLGYQPADSIDNIPLLPKQRYKYMFDYLGNKGKYAHNMMKGTASIHVSFDYSSEKDYIKKMKVSNFLSPLIYSIFDNSPFFEENIIKNESIREMIWNNCDKQRSGIINSVFDKDFGYERYAEYILNTPPIIFKNKDKINYTRNKLLKDLCDPGEFSDEEIEFALRMVFPDVRTKNFIEIRTADSLPYPYNFGYLAFWKGLLYNEKNLNNLYNRLEKYNKNEIWDILNNISSYKFEAVVENNNLFNYFWDLLKMAEKGLETKDKKYIKILKDLYREYKIPKNIVIDNLDQGKEKALNWSIINKNIKNEYVKECSCK